MSHMKPKGLIADYNRTLINGYHEIGLAYALLGKAAREGGWKRFFDLFFRLQPQCWKMALMDELDKLGPFFNREVLIGEDYDFVARYTTHHKPDLTRAERFGRSLPKIGKYIDTGFVDGTEYLLDSAHAAGTKTGIVSLSLAEFIRGHLKRYRLERTVGGILANSLVNENGIIGSVQYNVPPEDKGTNFAGFLEQLGLPADGDGVMYIGDSAEDYPLFRKVSHPVVSPLAKEEFRERCRYGSGLGEKKVLIPTHYYELAQR